MSATHTPLPWESEDYCVTAEGGTVGVAILEPLVRFWVRQPVTDPETMAANARLIVRAVNAHAALVAACESALKALTGPDSAGYQRDVAATLRAALALAKGETP
jgi:hypothetical protein